MQSQMNKILTITSIESILFIPSKNTFRNHNPPFCSVLYYFFPLLFCYPDLLCPPNRLFSQTLKTFRMSCLYLCIRPCPIVGLRFLYFMTQRLLLFGHQCWFPSWQATWNSINLIFRQRRKHCLQISFLTLLNHTEFSSYPTSSADPALPIRKAVLG